MGRRLWGRQTRPKFVKKPSKHRILRKHWENQSFSAAGERFFFLQKSFRQTAEEVGWPKEKGEQNASATKHKRK